MYVCMYVCMCKVRLTSEQCDEVVYSVDVHEVRDVSQPLQRRGKQLETQLGLYYPAYIHTYIHLRS